MRDLTALPKAHLHLHLEGAMRPETLADLARRQGAPVPLPRGSHEFTGFGQFLELYKAASLLVQDLADLRRVVREIVEDAAADGAVWVEAQTRPDRYADRFAPAAEVVATILDEGRATASRLGIGFGLMISPDRTQGPESAEALAEVAVSFAGRGVVAFGLAGDEAVAGPVEYARAFSRAREAGLLATPHAGELAGSESVRGAVERLGAVRIQHGVRAAEDPEVLRILVGEGVCLDVCPTSNVLLGVVPSMAEHPLPALLAAGVRCSLNADDPLLFGPGLLAEYELARHEMGLTDHQLAAVARTSLLASGAPETVLAPALAALDAWLGTDELGPTNS